MNHSVIIDIAAYWGAQYQLMYKGQKPLVGIINLYSLDLIEEVFLGSEQFSFHIKLKSLAFVSEPEKTECAIIGGSVDSKFNISWEPFQLWVGSTPANNQGQIIQLLQRRHYYVPGTIDEVLVRLTIA